MILETIILALGISSVVSTETTGKGLADHAISASKGKDCKMARTIKGEDVCQPHATVTVSAPPKDPYPPIINPDNPPPKKVVVVQNSIDRMEDVFAQRKAVK
jgi:hypothetical protein